jgi:hypothetical protein
MVAASRRCRHRVAVRTEPAYTICRRQQSPAEAGQVSRPTKRDSGSPAVRSSLTSRCWVAKQFPTRHAHALPSRSSSVLRSSHKCHAVVRLFRARRTNRSRVSAAQSPASRDRSFRAALSTLAPHRSHLRQSLPRVLPARAGAMPVRARSSCAGLRSGRVQQLNGSRASP